MALKALIPPGNSHGQGYLPLHQVAPNPALSSAPKNNSVTKGGQEFNYASQTLHESHGILVFALLLHSKMFSTAVCSRQDQQLWLGHFLSSGKQPRLCLVPDSASSQLSFFQPTPFLASKF